MSSIIERFAARKDRTGLRVKTKRDAQGARLRFRLGNSPSRYARDEIMALIEAQEKVAVRVDVKIEGMDVSDGATDYTGPELAKDINECFPVTAGK